MKLSLRYLNPLCVSILTLFIPLHAQANTINGTEGGEQLLGTFSADNISALGGDDQVFAFGGDDQINGGDGDDQLYGGNGSGEGSGSDLIIGGGGNDILIGEDGDDVLVGGPGNDSFYYMGNSGFDTVSDDDDGQDVVFFLDDEATALSYYKSEFDLIITTNDSQEHAVKVLNFFSDVLSEVYVQPASGYAISPSTIKTMATDYTGSEGGSSGGANILIEGTSGRDFVLGTDYDEQIMGLGGDDILVGGGGNDEYQILNSGGNDLIVDYGGSNIILFGDGVSIDTVGNNLTRISSDIKFYTDESLENSVTVKDFFGYSNTINEIRFSDGSSILASQLFDAFGVAAPSASISSTSHILGTANSDVVTGSSGWDIVLSGEGSDVLRGLQGGDVLGGGAGNDIYEIGAGSGYDFIVDVNGSNEIKFVDGITFNDVSNGLQRIGDDLLLSVGSGGDSSVRIYDFFVLADTIDIISFDDGSAISSASLFGAFGVSPPSVTASILDVVSANANPNTDDDMDGVVNGNDSCPNTPAGETVDSVGCSSSQADSDGDGVFDLTDLCPGTTDYLTVDQDGCSSGQRDSDGDGVFDDADMCSGTPSGASVDSQGCDDEDQDGVSALQDICPQTLAAEIESVDDNGCSASQRDSDGDSVSDLLDECPGTADGAAVNSSGCALTQLDSDGDGYNDAIDSCPATPVGEFSDSVGCSDSQRDTDGDGVADSLDDDDDGDLIPDADDAFPLDPDEYLDTDGDGLGDNADLDDDGDTYPDEEELNSGTDPMNWSSNPWFISQLKSKLPRTGEKTSYGNGDDAYENAGSPRIYIHDKDHEYVADKINNLYWEDSSHIYSGSLSWNDANSYCSNLELGGINNWRLPTANELIYLVDHNFSDRSYPGTAISSVFDSVLEGSYANNTFWSSETSSRGGISIVFGSAYLMQQSLTTTNRVRCVSGDQIAAPVFYKKGDVVIDKTNLLMWEDVANVQTNKLSWENALAYCGSLELNGSSDWRLPNYNEAYTLLGEISTKYNPAFSYTVGNEYSWSSTSKYSKTMAGPYQPSDAADKAWVFKAYPGVEDNYELAKFNQQYVRCVRTYSPPLVVHGDIPSSVEVGQNITIDASSSYDPDGTIVNYAWYDSKESVSVGSVAILEFEPSVGGTHVISLTLTDNQGIVTIQYFTVQVNEQDSDGDGYSDSSDAFPNDPSEWVDSDGDGVGDNADAFPNDANETLDSDGDGVGDNGDPFPGDSSEWADSDGDGVGDNADHFPNDVTESVDSDGDGTGDNSDAFPDDPTENSDSDADGIGDNTDQCPATDSWYVVDSLGCAIENPLTVCPAVNVEDDLANTPAVPPENIEWTGGDGTDVTLIERAFNSARIHDSSVSQFLKLPSQAVWDALTPSEKGLYLINSERTARKLKPYSVLSASVESVATNYANYTRENNLVINHYLNGTTPASRLDENATIATYRDGQILNESVHSQSGRPVIPDASGSVVQAVYFWLYNDKDWFVSFGLTSGKAWGHRNHLLQVGLNENNGSLYSEGAVGFGISTGEYNPNNSTTGGYGSVVVLNVVDEGPSWPESDFTAAPDTSLAQLCNSQSLVTLDSSAIDTAQVDRIEITPLTTYLAVGQTQQIKVLVHNADGSVTDLSQSAKFVADNLSVFEVSNGVVTALREGYLYLYAEIGGIRSNVIYLVSSSALTDTSNLIGTDAEALMPHIPANATVGAYDPKALAIYTGVVNDINNTGLEGVQISFLNHPEYGYVHTDNTGRFIISGPAGISMLVYEKAGLLAAERKVIGGTNQWSSVDTVVLLQRDIESSIDLSSGIPQVHQSSIVTDQFGSRKATVIFDGITEARVVSPDGSERVLEKFQFSATEHRVSEAMPGPLPVETAYTYCADLHVSGIRFDDTVKFDQDVVMVVDNFLGFNVGEVVPIGSYSMSEGEWKSGENGVIAQFVDVNLDGVVDGLDYTGDGLADDLDGDGQVSDEVMGLTDYDSGDTIMWGKFSHFSAKDYNYSQGTDKSSDKDKANTGDEDKDNDELECTASYVMPYQQAFHEDIPIAGTNLTLHYSSQRTHDYKKKISIPLTKTDLPPNLEKVIAHLEIGGRVFEQTFDPQENLYAEFFWDGTNVEGDYLEGTVSGEISVGYQYPTTYLSSGNAAEDGKNLDSYPVAWATIGDRATQVVGRNAYVAWTVQPVVYRNGFRSQLASGWSISNVHEYDGKESIYLGDGSVQDLRQKGVVLSTGVTKSLVDGDDGYYQKGSNGHDYAVTDVGTLLDNTTGLEWTLPTTSLRHTLFSARSYDRAQYVCNNLYWGNRSDWRLPTSKELFYAKEKVNNSSMDLFNRNILTWFKDEVNPENASIYIACVAGEENLDARNSESLVRNSSEDVVVDSSSGLMWQDSYANSSARMGWQDAVNYCEASEFAGYSDWRLPNVNELLYALPNSVFVNQTSHPDNYVLADYWVNYDFRQAYWSSTPSMDNANRAWAVESGAFAQPLYSMDEDYYVRCVRNENSVTRSPYIFDESGQHKKTVDLYSGKDLLNFSYDSEGRLLSIVDNFGNTMTIERNSDGVPTRIVAPDGQVTTLTVIDGNLTSVAYQDSSAYQFAYQGDLLTVKTEPKGNQFVHEFDANGRVVRTSDDEGGDWNFYDLLTAANDHTYGYNTAEGQTYQTVRSVLDDGSVQKINTNKTGAVTTHIVSEDQLTETFISNTGSTTVTNKVIDNKTQEEIPNVISVTQPSALASVTTISKTYAENGADLTRYQLTINHNGDTSTITNNGKTGVRTSTSAAGRQIITSRDPVTQLLQSVTSSGLNGINYTYDGRGRVVTERAGDRTTTYTYDAAGNTASITTPDNQTTTFGYDSLGRLTSSQYPDGNTLHNSYDANGNLSSIIVPTSVSHSFTHNAVNKISNGITPLSATTEYHYDRDRRLTSITLADGNSITNTYSNGNLASTTRPEGTTTYRYQNGDQLTAISEGSEQLSYSYDGDLLTGINYGGQLNTSIGYGYNNNFNINSLSYAGASTSLSYDVDGLLTGIHGFTIARDSQNGLPSSISDNSYSQSRNYNGYAETTDFNQQVNNTGINTSLTYNTIGKITQKTETITTTGGTTTNTYVYAYDSRNRLTGVTLNGTQTERYTYDANGRRTNQTSTQVGVNAVTASYNNDDQITRLGDTTYGYDGNGRLNSKTTATGTTTYQYSSDGRLLKVVTPEKTITYQHNAMGNRVAKLIDGTVVEKYLWQNKTTLLAIYDANDNLKQRYEYTLGNTPTAFTQNGSQYYIITDQLGSPRIVTDASGNIVKQLRYDSYGNVIEDTDPIFTIPFGFAGGLQDQDTGLIRFGYRDYDPETGRWTARDPIGFAGGDSNLYGYVLGDPVNGVDPTGLFLDKLLTAAVLITGYSFYQYYSGLSDSATEFRIATERNEIYAEAARKQWECRLSHSCSYEEVKACDDLVNKLGSTVASGLGSAGYELARSTPNTTVSGIGEPSVSTSVSEAISDAVKNKALSAGSSQ